MARFILVCMAACVFGLCFAQTEAPTAPTTTEPTVLPAVTPTAPPVAPMSVGPTKAIEMNRIAKSAVIDGKLDTGEWFPLWTEGDVTAFVQWADDMLYVAAKYPKGRSLIISLDGSGKGWLKAAGNVEIMLPGEDVAQLKVRFLDNKGQMPVWLDSALFKARLTASAGMDGDAQFVEMAIPSDKDDGFVWEENKEFGLRVDTLDPASADRPAYEPRLMSTVRLVFDKMAAPKGLKSKMSWDDRLVAPNDTIKITTEFKNEGTEPFLLKNMTFLGNGPSEMTFDRLEHRCSPIDPLKKSKVEYKSTLPSTMPLGTYVIDIVSENSDGSKFFGQSSFTVDEPVIVQFHLNKLKIKLDKKNRFKGEIWLDAHTQKDMKGNMMLYVQPGFTILKGENAEFDFPRTRMRKVNEFEIEVPAGTAGITELKLQISLGKRTITRSTWVEIMPTSPAQ
ncbi:MAG: hypothetical protein WCO51_01415 [bacterium]